MFQLFYQEQPADTKGVIGRRKSKNEKTMPWSNEKKMPWSNEKRQNDKH
jgi:hypothetical protein